VWPPIDPFLLLRPSLLRRFIAMVPCVVLYLTLQCYRVQGLTSGAVKG
jgi:hypothetical protein